MRKRMILSIAIVCTCIASLMLLGVIVNALGIG